MFYDSDGMLWNLTKTPLKAVLGTDDLGNEPEKFSKRRRKKKNVKSIEVEILTYLIHDNYRNGEAYNDVALALISKVEFSGTVFPICLPDSPVLFQDHLMAKDMTVLGFSFDNPDSEGEFLILTFTIIFEVSIPANCTPNASYSNNFHLNMDAQLLAQLWRKV